VHNSHSLFVSSSLPRSRIAERTLHRNGLRGQGLASFHHCFSRSERSAFLIMNWESFGDRHRLVKSWLIPCLRPARDCGDDTPGLFRLPVGTSGDERYRRHYPLVTSRCGLQLWPFRRGRNRANRYRREHRPAYLPFARWHVAGVPITMPLAVSVSSSRDFASPKSRTFIADFAIMMLPGLRSRCRPATSR
jgi:hypothetical protein